MSVTMKSGNGQLGFTLVETLIALLILSGGLLALAYAVAEGMATVSTSHYHQIAKEKASEAMESVFTARDAGKIPNWNAIQNTGANGLFLDGPQSILEPGPDGLVNTADDGDAEMMPGPDGRLGTDDDESLEKFTREIAISNVRANLRQIRVIVRYSVGRSVREYKITSFITPFA